MFTYFKHTLNKCELKSKLLLNHRLGTKKTLSQHDMAVKSYCVIYVQSFVSPMFSRSLRSIRADPHDAYIGLRINLRPIVFISCLSFVSQTVFL